MRRTPKRHGTARRSRDVPDGRRDTAIWHCAPRLACGCIGNGQPETGCPARGSSRASPRILPRYAIVEFTGLSRLLTDETFRGLLDSAPDGILVCAPDGTIAVVNSQVEQLFGYTREELIGKRPEVLVPDDVAHRHVAHTARYEARPTTRPMGAGLDLTAKRRDGSTFPVEISLSPRETSDGTLRCGRSRHHGSPAAAGGAQRPARRRACRATSANESRWTCTMGSSSRSSAWGWGWRSRPRRLAARPPRRSIETAIDQLNDVIRDIRAYIFELGPTAYDGNLADSLAATRRRVSREFADRHRRGPRHRRHRHGRICRARDVPDHAGGAGERAQAFAGETRAARGARATERRDHRPVADDGVGFDPSEEVRGIAPRAAKSQQPR